MFVMFFIVFVFVLYKYKLIQKIMRKHLLLLVFKIQLLMFTNAKAQIARKEIGNLITEDIPEIPNRIFERVTQYQNVRSAALQGWLSDGSGMLITTRFGEATQLHIVRQPLGMREQLTFYNEPIENATVNPNPKYQSLIFSKDIGGNEFYQLFYFDLNTYQIQMFTDGKSRNGSVVWSNNGERFLFTSTQRNGKDYDLYLGNTSRPSDYTLLLEREGLWYPIDWSPDDKQVIIGQYISANESYLYILDLSTKALSPLNPSKEKISYGTAKWSADGKGIFMVTDEKTEFQTLRYYELSTKKFTNITETIPWDVATFAFTKDRTKLAFVTNEDGISRLYLMNTKNFKFKPLGNLPMGVIGGIEFHPRGNQLAVTINTPQTPSDIFSIDIKNGKTIRWTSSETGGLRKETFVIPTLITYTTFDGKKIPAFYYKPHGNIQKIPVLIRIHGGPEAQYQPDFSSQIQYYVNELKIAVIAPNVRGSSGYGKTYLQLDNGYQREDAVKDIGALLDWIAQQPELDAQRIAVMGGSYGGYMTLASMVHFNDRLKCGIDIVGISNFVTFLSNTQEYRRDLRRAEYGDERIPEMRSFLEKISPLNHAEKITKPLFVVQGLNDPRVPVSEAEQMVQKIREIGGKVWYLLAKDEGHGFKKKANIDFYNSAVVLFLEENLLK